MTLYLRLYWEFFKTGLFAIGGGMANTFLHAQGVDVGGSLCEKDLADTALEIMEEARRQGCELLLPVDVVVAKGVKPGIEHGVRAPHSLDRPRQGCRCCQAHGHHLAAHCDRVAHARL